MNVGDICRTDVVTIRGFDELIVAAHRMRERHVGYLIVVEPLRQGVEPGGRMVERPIGVLTDRDLVVTVMAGGADPRLLKVEDVMTRRVVTAREHDKISDALVKMRSIGVRRLPVITEGGALAGVLSIDDVLDWVSGDLQNIVGSIRQEQQTECARRP